MRFRVGIVFLFYLVCVLGLSSCGSTVARKSIQGRYSDVVQESEEASYANMDLTDLYEVCSSMLSVRNYLHYQKCYRMLESRRQANGGHLGLHVAGWTPFAGMKIKNLPWSEFDMADLQARYAYDLGNFKEAARLADRMMQLTSTKKFLPDALDDDKIERIQGRALRGVGLAALAYVKTGQDKKLQQALAYLEGINTGTLEGRGLDKLKKMAIARVYFLKEDYERAYKVLTESTHRTLGGFFVDGVVALSYVNPAAYVMLPLQTGTLTVNELSFASKFEWQFLLYRAELETGRLEDAAAGYDEILADDRVQSFGNVYFPALHGRGLVAEKQGKTDEAISYFKQAIDVLETQRASVTSERGRIGFLGRKQNVYRDIVSLLIARGRAAEAFKYAERGKARALVDLLATKQKFPGRTATSKSLGTLLADVNQEEATQIAKVQEDGKSVRAVKLVARERLAKADPELASLVSVQGVQLDDIQKLLPKGEVLLEYFGGGDDLFVFVVNANSISAATLDGKGLAADVAQFRRDIQSLSHDAYRKSGNRLYRRLIAPIENSLTGQSVTIVPHGPLHYLPFAALVDDNNQFLLQRWAVRVLPSASVLDYIRPRQAIGEGATLVLGNPDLGDPKLALPGAEVEARSISETQPQATLLLGKQATETAFRNEAGKYQIVHFAGHGTFDAKRPLDSALLMARDSDNDGTLQVRELYEFSLNADLVTLSGCETALGEIMNGDDVIGFTRGFLFAGARSIVSSLWQVDDDATRQLMETFYKDIPNTDKRRALRDAQLGLIRSGKSDPFYWAAFELTGAID